MSEANSLTWRNLTCCLVGKFKQRTTKMNPNKLPTIEELRKRFPSINQPPSQEAHWDRDNNFARVGINWFSSGQAMAVIFIVCALVFLLICTVPK